MRFIVFVLLCIGLLITGCSEDDTPPQGGDTVEDTASGEGEGEGYGEGEDTGTVTCEEEGGFVDTQCMSDNCQPEMNECFTDLDCADQIACSSECMSLPNAEQQRCYIACFAPVENRKLNALFGCGNEAECFNDPEPYNCPVPSSELTNVSLDTLEGSWYVVRGLNKTYDCWNCQEMSIGQISDENSLYNYNYEVEQGKITTVKCTITSVSPGYFTIDYSTYGIDGSDEWYVLSHPHPNYMFIYYCGSSSMDSYRGGVLISRSRDTDIPANIITVITDDLSAAGLSDPFTLENMCITDNSDCIVE